MPPAELNARAKFSADAETHMRQKSLSFLAPHERENIITACADAERNGDF